MKEKKKRCCKYHNNFQYIDMDLTECGMSGMGTPTICCPKCPEKEYYDKKGIIPDYYIDDIKKGLTLETEAKSLEDR